MIRANYYNRNAAVEYALKYAVNPNPSYRFFIEIGDGGGDCTSFISQCILAGGAPMDYNSSWPWWYRKNNTQNTSDDTWSISWTVAHSFYWTLKSRNQLKLPGLKAVEVNDISILELGDLIQYEDNTKIYHTAIITAFTYQGGVNAPLISQHTYNRRNISYIKPKAKKMHFMKIYVT